MANHTTGHCCGSSYAGGPTTCIASPEVMADISEQISQENILSVADARIATMAGLLAIPSVGKIGFNDGVIYPPATLQEAPQKLVLGFESTVADTGGIQPSQQAAIPSAAGRLNCLVLLVDFEDNQGSLPASHFESLLFDDGNPDSMRSFYQDLSYGALDIDGVVTEWIRADHPYDYYTAGESGTGGNYPNNTPGLLHEVLQKYCANNSLAPFDQNGDGFMDGLFLVHAGGGAEAERDRTRRPHMIWSHKWVLPEAFENDGVSAFAYFTAPEDGLLGVFAHEFGHFLGLPDLYDTSYRSKGLGDWCLMAGGSWAGGGQTPVRLSAWCLAQLNWIQPVNVTGPETLALAPLEQDAGACYRLWSNGDPGSEYFLIENRQQQGRDIGLPGSGLAVWHIDETQSDNTNPLSYRVALIQADGKRELEFSRNDGDPGDLFPGSGNVTALDDAGAHPHTRANDGTATGVALSGITQNGTDISVDVTV
ncbi:MAG TPA: M6 family metalloprotease domain-containing protein [Allosphingosinicella sp.]|nr:M6 family metalloprotease domain-containing protein [Allosphingosinicella sp.]